MTPRALTDDQIAVGLRTYVPVPHAALRGQILTEVASTPQERRLPWIVGGLTDADPTVRRRMTLLVMLFALAASVAFVAIAGALLRQQRPPELSIEVPAPSAPPVATPGLQTPALDPLGPPADLGAFVRSAYDDMPKLQPMTITALTDGTRKTRIYVDGSGAVRIEEFDTIQATQPSSYKIFAGSTIAELAKIGSKRVWYKQADAISEDPRVFVFASLGAARTDPAPGCEVAVSPGEEYSGAPGRGWRYVGLEYVAGRPAHHVQCGDEMWIDVATRLTLRSLAAAPAAADSSPGPARVEVTSIELGQPPSGLFEMARPKDVAEVSPEEYGCSMDSSCGATPAPITTPPPARAKAVADGAVVVAAALRAVRKLAWFDVVVERTSGMIPKVTSRLVADGHGRFRLEGWSGDDSTPSVGLIGPGYRYQTDQLTDGTPVWRDRSGATGRGLPTYPLQVPTTCATAWEVKGVDDIHGRIADHVRCKTATPSDYWIDRNTHLVVRTFHKLAPTSGWEASEVISLRLEISPGELFELPPGASLRP
jgi:hypothetical protein